MRLTKSKIGHWKVYNKHPSYFDNEKYFGFLYCIENKITNQFYIGKKQFFHHAKRSSKLYNKEMNWRSYTSSSLQLNKDIKEHGKNNFDFIIVDLYKTKGGLYYSEVYSQVVLNCLTERLEDNITPLFYNRQIAAVRFIPKEPPTQNTKLFIKDLSKRLNIC
jgi:hypothetical protein